MKYGSVCSGIEAASMAWGSLGWSPAFFAEVDKFPCAVLSHHHGSNMPDEPYVGINGVPNYGDLSKFKDWPDHADLDVLVGGTPCQSFSVAGLRKGLDDPRGNLALVYLALVDRYRPRWVVWENVPGVLSSDDGRDFGSFLGALAKLGYGFSYRVLDAQYIRVDGYAYAVPQRRRRVFVVGYLGDWRRAAAVLFEPESLRRDTPPRREAGQGIATSFEIGPGGGSQADVAPTLDTRAKDGPIRNQLAPCALVPAVSRSLNAHGVGGGKPGQGYSAIAIQERATSENLEAGPGGKGYQEDIAYTLEARNRPQSVALNYPMTVRRLTPRECERLQGFPDDYTKIPYRGREADNCPDGPRYKALGNSMAVNVMRWIGQRIDLAEQVLTK